MSGIDEQLISRSTVSLEAEKAGQFRAAIRGESSNNPDDKSSFREQVQAVRKIKDIAKEKKDQLLSSPNPVNSATDAALKFAWENLLTSWGLTLLYIDAHAFLNKVFGPLVFRDLGQEWVPAGIRKVGDQKSKQVSGMLSIAEKAGCGCLNLGCLIIVISIFSLIAMIVSGISNPLELIKVSFDSLWNWFVGSK